MAIIVGATLTALAIGSVFFLMAACADEDTRCYPKGL